VVVVRASEVGRRILAVCAALLLIGVAADWGWQSMRAGAANALQAEVIRRVPTADRAVALTFSLNAFDAAGIQSVEQILSGFAVPATFFVTATLARSEPGLIAALIAAGDEVEPTALPLPPHSTPAAWQASLLGDIEAVEGQSGHRPTFVRPPTGSLPHGFLTAATDLGLTVTGAQVAPQDQLEPGTDVIINRTLAGIVPGAIILLHPLPQSAAALPAIIDGLTSQGYTLVSLAGLFSLTSGQVTARSAASAIPTVQGTLG